jgi:hypothetical protein
MALWNPLFQWAFQQQVLHISTASVEQKKSSVGMGCSAYFW